MIKSLELNTAITLPMPETIHEVMLACGYSLTKQELLHLEYVKPHDGGVDQRVIFGYGLTIVCDRFYNEPEEDRLPHWHNEYTMRACVPMGEMQILNVLQAWEAIDYQSLPEFKKVVRTAYLEVQQKQKVA